MRTKNYLLKYCREALNLSSEDIYKITGISVKNYESMEAGITSMLDFEAELLGALFDCNPEYIKALSHFLTMWEHYNGIMDRQDDRFKELTNALKRKITDIKLNRPIPKPNLKKIQTIKKNLNNK